MTRVLSVFNFPVTLCDLCGDSGLELEGRKGARYVPSVR